MARLFFRAAARVIDIPWQLAVRVVNAYIARIFRVAPHDAVVSAAFLRVVHMLAAPPTLFAPRILWRVLAHRHPAALPVRLAPARAGT